MTRSRIMRLIALLILAAPMFGGVSVVLAQSSGEEGGTGAVLPLQNVSAGVVGTRSPGIWVSNAVGRYNTQHDAVYGGLVSNGVGSEPTALRQMRDAALVSFLDFFRNLIIGLIYSLDFGDPGTDSGDDGTVVEPDADADGVPDASDNCVDLSNADQADADADGFGDVCDLCSDFDDAIDADEDGVPDGCDNCPNTANADQANSDIDPRGDACDNCPLVTNPSQTDLNDDGVGDVCENDADGDSWNDVTDNCPEVFNPDQADEDADGIGNACDPTP